MADLNQKCSMGKGVRGSYDNLLLETKCAHPWRHAPCDKKLKSQYLFVGQGPLPLNPVLSDISDEMFMLSRNYVSPYCCPSTYSSSNGCVCTTPEQIRYIASRGRK